MPRRPTAVIYTNQILPFGIFRGLAERGLTPGKDLSVIGIGSRLANFLTPNITHYSFDLYNLGERIAKALLQVIDDPYHGRQSKVIQETVPFTFVEGDSVGEENIKNKTDV